MKAYKTICSIFSLILLCKYVFATEFTFDLPDSAEQCFHEVIEVNVSCVFEFQVRRDHLKIESFEKTYLILWLNQNIPG